MLLIAQMRRASRAARLRLTTPASPLPSHTDHHPKSPPPPAVTVVAPSPYSASSAYSYSYAYSNTPPPRHAVPPPPPPPLVLPPTEEEDEDEEDDNAVRAHYLYMPPTLPVSGDLLARRRGMSPDRAGAPMAATGPPPRAWSFAYAFTFRGRRRRLAVQAPAWWPRRGGAAGARRRRRRGELWSAVGRDLGRVMGPAMLVWVMLLWLY
jgi:hypothetical protein